MYLATDYRNSVQSYGFFPEQPNIYGIFCGELTKTGMLVLQKH